MTIGRIAAGMLALLSTAALAAPVLTASSSQTTTVLVGCLYREIEVSGNPGTYDDYILADASTPARGPSPPAAIPGATGTSGIVPATGNMYEIENVRDFRLEGFVGMRVELTGTIDPKHSRSDSTELPEFEARAIRAVAGTCPLTPAPRE